MNDLCPQLFDELLECIVGGVPLPNADVYSKPWIRDAAMMAMVLERTNELHRIRNWVEGLMDPFDRNNGSEEPDNLGQALYLVSLFADDSHPLASEVLKRLPEFQNVDGEMTGTTDFAVRPIYAGRWLNFGLSKLGLAPQASIPTTVDAYECLFWMDGLQPSPLAPKFGDDINYPYLTWASAHTFRDAPPMNLLERIPGILTWESEASAADYDRLPAESKSRGVPRLCAPHSWHAAEAWLYLDDLAAMK